MPGDDRDPFNTLRPQVHTLTARQQLVFHPASLLLRVYYRTWRLRTLREELAAVRALPLPYIVAGWHNRTFVAPPVMKAVFPPDSLDCLISPSRDAAWEVAFFRQFGINAIRGSTTRRSIQAMRELFRTLDGGRIVLISPDGPSGPLYSIQSGVIRLARRRRVPIVYFAINTSWARRLKSWDHHLMALPFATLTTRLGILHADDPVWQQEDAVVVSRLQRDLLEITDDPDQVPRP